MSEHEDTTGEVVLGEATLIPEDRTAEEAKPAEEPKRLIRVTAELGMTPAAKWCCPACGQVAMSMDGRLLSLLHAGLDTEITCACGCKQTVYVSRISRDVTFQRAQKPSIQGV